MEIQWVGMTRDHWQVAPQRAIRMLVIHATAGRAPSDLEWLRQGGSDQRPVSVHYYIDKEGSILQLVADEHIAWHAGESSWLVDDQQVTDCNAYSLGIEIENLNSGYDPYPPQQVAAAAWLSQRLVTTYAIPRSQLVRHLDIAPGRKSDPAGFAWEQFVADVYGAADATPPAADEALRRALWQCAWQAAGTDAPAQWPLRDYAQTHNLGMPIFAITRRDAASTPPPPAAAQNDLARPVTLAGHSLVLEAYADDLLYAPPDALDQVARLATTAPGPLRDALLQALFCAADPLHGFQASWAFHRYYLGNAAALGVPLSPNVRLAVDGGEYVCQHFARDTLCAPVGNWQQISRLTDLVRDAGQPLTRALLDDLYRLRTGRNFDPQALLCRYALAQGLGAPLADGQEREVGGQQLLLMPFARDVLACVVGANDEAAILSLSALGGAGESPTTFGMLGAPLPPSSLPLAGRLLGPPLTVPHLLDLSLHDATARPEGASPALLVLYPVEGPCHRDLQALRASGAERWHYYIDQRGKVLQLVADQHLANAATGTLGHGWSEINSRSLAIAVEGAGHGINVAQQQSLRWLLGLLSRRYGLRSDQIVTTSDWHTKHRAVATLVASSGYEEHCP